MTYPSEYQIGKDIENLRHMILKLDERLSRIESNNNQTAGNDLDISKLYPDKIKMTNFSLNKDAVKSKNKIKADSVAGKVLNCIRSHTKICKHEIDKELDLSSSQIQNSLVYLKKKQLIVISANTYTCRHSTKLHAYYTIAENAESLALNKTSVRRKIKDLSTFVTPNSLGAKVLKYLETVSTEVCAHDIAENIKVDHKAVVAAISTLIKKGHVQQAEELKLCKYSTIGKKHLHFKLTREITPEIYLNIREEERKIADEKYAKKLDKMSEVLDLNSYDQTTTYLYRDVLKVFNSNKGMEWLYSSFIGSRAKEQFTTDEGWKIIEGVLDRLEQEHYVTRNKLYGVAGTKWKLTRRGNDKLLGLDSDGAKV